MTLRPQYHFRPSAKGHFAWNVAKLIRAAEDIAPKHVPLAEIKELDETYWFIPGDPEPTVRAVADHARLIAHTDPAYPILLCADGRVMDGMHRVAKAYLDGKKSILAKRFVVTPAPDFEDVYPDDLPYDPAKFSLKSD